MASQPGFSYKYKPWEFDSQESTPPLELAYALTVHKTQGSEFGKTFVVIPNPCRNLTREMLYTGRPLKAAEALTCGLVSAVTPDVELDAYGLALAADMLRAQPDALRLSKRSFDATLDAVSLDAALEIEERAQMLMIARRRAEAT